MQPRRHVHPAVWLCAALLCAQSTAAAERERSEILRLELPKSERPRRMVRELLGRNRVRSLNLTRYQMALYGLDFTPELSNQRAVLEEAEDVMLSNLLRVWRERLERELLLKQRYDVLRARLRGREPGGLEPLRPKGLDPRISPRIYLVDRDALVGAKLRLRGLRSPIWSRAGLGVTHELSGDNLRLELSINEPAWATSLVFHTDRRRVGESVELRVAISF